MEIKPGDIIDLRHRLWRVDYVDGKTRYFRLLILTEEDQEFKNSIIRLSPSVRPTFLSLHLQK